MTAEQLRAELVVVLGAAREPVTTAAARIAVTNKRGGQDRRPVVAEQVYRALLILQRRGAVRRVPQQAGRHAQWELVRPQARGPRVDPVEPEAKGTP